jgi:flagellar motor switch protein FliN
LKSARVQSNIYIYDALPESVEEKNIRQIKREIAKNIRKSWNKVVGVKLGFTKTLFSGLNKVRLKLAPASEIVVLVTMEVGTTVQLSEEEEFDGGMINLAYTYSSLKGIRKYLNYYNVSKSKKEKPLSNTKPAASLKKNLEDVKLDITVRLGSTKKPISEVLAFGEGTIVELDKLAGEPVEMYAGEKLIAYGEVVVVDENFGVRITEVNK